MLFPRTNRSTYLKYSHLAAPVSFSSLLNIVNMPELKSQTPTFYHLLATFFVSISFCIEIAFLDSRALGLSLTFWHHGASQGSDPKWTHAIIDDLDRIAQYVLRRVPETLAVLFLLYCGIIPYLWKRTGKLCSSLHSRPLLVETLQSTIFLPLLLIVGRLIHVIFAIPSCLMTPFLYGSTGRMILAVWMTCLGAAGVLVLGIFPISILVYLWHRSPYCVPFLLVLLKFVGTICRDAWHYYKVVRAPEIFKQLSLSNSLDIQISHLANKLGFPVGRIFITKYMDSKIAFAGGLFPFFKRIIIRDDVYEGMSEKVAMALAAREMGHWYLNHEHKKILVELFFDLARAILCCFLAFTPAMYTAFGFETPTQQQSQEIELEPNATEKSKPKMSRYNPKLMPLCIALLLFLPLQVPIMDMAKYTLNAMTIHQHYSVDQFAVEQGYKEGLVELLKPDAQSPTGSVSGYVEYCTMEVPTAYHRLSAITID